MPANIGPSDADRYGWPGVGEAALDAEATRIARLLIRSRARIVGLLPVDRFIAPGKLAPLLLRIAQAELGFVNEDVGVVDTWATWPWGEAMAAGEEATHRLRLIAPRIVEIAPTPCGDPLAAAVALENALAGRAAGLAQVLVNLGGYSPPGVMPSSLRVADGVVLLASARRTRRGSVVALAGQGGAGKVLGSILLG